MTVNRLSGLMIAGFGLLLFFVVVPAQVESVTYGWVRPETVPNALAIGFVVLGGWQVLVAGGGGTLEAGAAIRVASFLVLTAAAVWAMGRVGFLWIAPVMMLVIMLLIGERRPLWLGLGATVLPVLVWVVVTQLLGRTLPG